MDEQDLSEEHMHQLLQDAEQRLRASEQTTSSKPNEHLSLSTSNASISTGPTSSFPSLYVKSTSLGAQVAQEFLIDKNERKLAGRPRCVDDPIAVKANAAKLKKASAGSNWYNLPRTVLTPELKRDLQLLRMRSVLDPKRHYKKDNNRKNDVPEFSQVGTIIEGPTEFFTSRLTNKERKRTFVEDVLAGEKKSQRFKSKYNEIQLAKTSGKKAHYKALKAQRARKTCKG